MSDPLKPNTPETPEPQRTTDVPDVKQPNNILTLSLNLHNEVDRRRLEALQLLLEVKSLPFTPLPTASHASTVPTGALSGTAPNISAATEGAHSVQPQATPSAAPASAGPKPQIMHLMVDTEGPWP